MTAVLRIAAAALLCMTAFLVSPGAAQAATPTWSSIAAGQYHTCGIRTSGALYCWGDNEYGQLGLGNTTNRKTPVRVGTSANWAGVTAGDDHTCARHKTGALFCWGRGTSGQLGLGTNATHTTPKRVGTTTNWTSIDAGGQLTCARHTTGALYCWGQNTDGQLGVGDTTGRNKPAKVGTSTGWSSVSVGRYHVCARHSNGSIYCWGWGGQGQLGLNSLSSKSRPTKVGTSTSWTSNVSAGEYSTCALHSSRRTYCWGSNAQGQLGVGGTANRDQPTRVGVSTGWTKISSAHQHTCARFSSGSLYCWGYNHDGQLGLGHQTGYRDRPTKVGTFTGWTNSIVGGRKHTCALHQSGAAYCWGYNGNGQLGLGAIIERFTPGKITG